MILEWEANGKLKPLYSESFFQYSALFNKLFVLSRVLSNSDTGITAQFGKINKVTGVFENVGDPLPMLGNELRENYYDDVSPLGFLYQCYIPKEILKFDEAVAVSLTAAIDTGFVDSEEKKGYQVITSGIYVFKVQQSLSGGTAVMDENLKQFKDEVEALERAFEKFDGNAVLVGQTDAEAVSLGPNENPTVELKRIKGEDPGITARFSFGIPRGHTIREIRGAKAEDFGVTQTQVEVELTDGSRKDFDINVRNGIDGNGFLAVNVVDGDLYVYTKELNGVDFSIDDDGCLVVNYD